MLKPIEKGKTRPTRERTGTAEKKKQINCSDDLTYRWTCICFNHTNLQPWGEKSSFAFLLSFLRNTPMHLISLCMANRYTDCKGNRYRTREIIMFTKAQWNKELTHILGSQKDSKRNDLQIENLPPWESALKWGPGGVQPGSWLPVTRVKLPSPVLQGWLGPFPGWSSSGSAVTQFPCNMQLFSLMQLQTLASAS